MIQAHVQIERLLTREETAELLGMSVSWVKGEIRAGRLRSVKLGNRVRIEPQDLRNFIHQYGGGVAKNVGTPRIPGLFGPDTVKLKMLGKARG